MVQADTIGAVATAVGEGGIGIVRLSGDRALEIAARIFVPARAKKVAEIPSHRATYGRVIDPVSREVVDEGLLLTMRAPHSYTREHVAEIHCHGGAMALRTILALALREGARLAEPGEFTKRAFLNGRLDLTQAQAVMDVIRSKTDASLRMAVGHLAGELSEKVRGYREKILALIAHLEAAIDFPEEDIEAPATEQVREQVAAIRGEIDALLKTAKTGRILREGLETAIVGKPNVGKSSLLNALLKENRAIVTDIPGTTRDVIEEFANVGGIPLKIIDTAGIRATEDVVERLGVDRARAYIERADLVLALLDYSRPLSAEDEEILQLAARRQAIVIVNKIDLPGQWELAAVEKLLPGCQTVRISTASGAGFPELEETIAALAYGGKVRQGEGAFVGSVRQAEILRSAAHCLAEVAAALEKGLPPDFLAIDLRAAWEKLGELTGDTVDEDILDRMFSQFCIGK